MPSAPDETAGVLAAGWYPEAGAPARARWWDGERWTANILDNGDPGIAWVPALVDAQPPIVSMINGELVIDLTGVGEAHGAPDIADIAEPHDNGTRAMVVLHGGAPGVHAPSRFFAPTPLPSEPAAVTEPVVLLEPVVREHDSPTTTSEIARLRRTTRHPRRRLAAAAAAAALLISAVIASAVAIGTDSTSNGNQPSAVFQSQAN